MCERTADDEDLRFGVGQMYATSGGASRQSTATVTVTVTVTVTALHFAAPNSRSKNCGVYLSR